MMPTPANKPLIVKKPQITKMRVACVCRYWGVLQVRRVCGLAYPSGS